MIACGYHAEDILRCVSASIDQFSSETLEESFVPTDYKITNTSQRVVNLILGTALLSNDWDGIRKSE